MTASADHPGSRTVAPIPPMPEHYRDPAERQEWLRRIFDETAGDYDRVEALLSFGTGRWYRRDALSRAGLGAGMSVLDVATGTGLVAREALSLVGPAGRVVGIDPSAGMLDRARAALGIETVVGRAENLPFPDASFDFISMGYALRHLSDLAPAFTEFARVLKPGGRVCILEITRPESTIGRAVLRTHIAATLALARCVRPTAGRTSELWRYYWKTIDLCVPPGVVLKTLGAAGFADAACTRKLGVFAEFVAHRGVEPARNGGAAHA